MLLDLQKASLLKRVSAYILDMILVLILAVGFSSVFSWLFGYDTHVQTFTEKEIWYEEKYGVDFSISQSEYDALPDEEKQIYLDANDEFQQDTEVIYAWSMMINLTFLIITLGTLLAYLILEFLIPLILGNGQSVGRKIFAIGVMHTNSVKIKPTTLFIRHILGKYTMETMIPIYILLMILFGSLGIVGTVLLVAILVLQLAVIFATKTHSTIHDLLSNTVCVDLASQMIFESEEALNRYKAERAREAAQNEQ